MKNGLSRMKFIIMYGLIFLTIWYIFLLLTFDKWNNNQFMLLLSPADEFCYTTTTSSSSSSINSNNNTSKCTRNDLFAFQMSSFIPITICGCLGFYYYHISGILQQQQQQSNNKMVPPPQMKNASSYKRIYGTIQQAHYITAINFTFQLWDFIISLYIVEHRTIIMLSHHIMASIVSFCSLRYNILDYYSFYFLGTTEISSIFLVFIDLAKYFPPQQQQQSKTYDYYYYIFVRELCAPMFVITFTIYRVLLWWPMSIRLFLDVYEVVMNGHKKKKTITRHLWVLYLFLMINIPLGLLQLYWFTIIIEEVKREFL